MNEIANESSVEYPYLPKNLKEVEENEDGNVIVEASALNMSQKKYDKLSGEEMAKIVITKDKFTLRNKERGMAKVDLVGES